jgi:hypothetical protein
MAYWFCSSAGVAAADIGGDVVAQARPEEELQNNWDGLAYAWVSAKLVVMI